MSSTTFKLEAEFGEKNDLVVRAGAGAGKTTELVKRVLSIAWFQKQKTGYFPSLTVTTFTRKATQELRERLLKAALETEQVDLINYVQSGKIHISTIHGILSHLLRRYGQVMGLQPDFKFIDNDQNQIILKKIIRKIVNAEASSASAEALEDILSETRFDELLSSLEKFIEISISGETLKRVSVEEFKKFKNETHELLLRQCRILIEAIDDKFSPKWLDFKSELYLLKQAIEDKNEDALILFLENNSKPAKSAKISEDIITARDQLFDLCGLLANYNMSSSYFDRYESLSIKFESLASQVAKQVMDYKINNGKLSLADLESFALYLLNQFPVVGEQFSKEWDYWLVDEYQDTSPRQVRLIEMLSKEKKRFIVGDPQQSIYLFRGARSQVFLSEEQAVINKGGQLRILDTNYRSHAELLTFFNYFFTRIGDQFKPMQPGRKDSADSKIDPLVKTVATFVDLSTSEIENAEGLQALIHSQELIQSGAKPESICILARTHTALEKILHFAHENKIPAQMHSNAEYNKRREVLDALSLLKFIINPHDNLNFINLVRSPWFKIEDQLLHNMSLTKPKSFWNHCVDTQTKHHAILNLKKAIQLSYQKGISEAWLESLKESGIIDYSTFLDSSGRREANLWKLVQKLKMSERQPGFNFGSFLEEHEINVELETGEMSDAVPVVEPSRINLMTIHASKGLQFDHIILVGAGDWRVHSDSSFLAVDEDGTWSLALSDPESGKATVSVHGQQAIKKRQEMELQEYDRLLYVALTRARESVFILWDQNQKNSWVSRMWKPAENTFEFGFRAILQAKQIESSELSFNAPSFNPNLEIVNLKPQYQLLSDDDEKVSRVSVTSLIEASPTKKAQQDSQIILKSLSKAQFGTDFHRYLEMTKYKIDIEIPNEIKKEINWTLQFNEGLIRDLIYNGFVEDSFVLRKQNKWLQGQIDLWGLSKTGDYYIVDYKTGNPASKEKAIDQMKIYAWALIQMGKIPANLKDKRIKLLALYPFYETFEEQLFQISDVQFKLNQ
jgi:ATP-dependent helicase/nuclease subunit A